jgi:GNAT superfamily N-acetyltransferase
MCARPVGSGEIDRASAQRSRRTGRLGGVRIEPADPRSAEVEALLAAYVEEMQATFDYQTERGMPITPADFDPGRGSFLVVRDDDGLPIGCGGVRLLDPATAEVKRMWLQPSARGRGLGRALLAALEEAAVDLGASRGVLDTFDVLGPAMALYRNAGWQEVPAYNENRQATHWFAKDLTGQLTDVSP